MLFLKTKTRPCYTDEILTLLFPTQSKETEIKKQYNATVGIQNRQYKALGKQIKDTLPKERQREVMRQVKDEQNRKVALLASQYERTMAETVQRLTVSLMSSLFYRFY